MSEFVHYLVKHPDLGGLVYPTELADPTFVAFGGFYLLAAASRTVRETYRFHAVLGEETIETTLVPYRRSRRFFSASLPEVGTFLFYAQVVPGKPPYVGASVSARDHIAIRRLRSWHPEALDAACRRHLFYFVGYSPRIEEK